MQSLLPLSAFNDVNSVFRSFFDDAVAPTARSVNDRLLGQGPRVDLTETENAYRLQAELPGVKREDVELTYHDGVLVIAGTKKSEDEQTEGALLRERHFAAFKRAFRLPAAVDASAIRADLADGILCVELPKAEEARPRTIEVHGS